MNFARIWCITNPTAARRVSPPWIVYMAKLTPTERITTKLCTQAHVPTPRYGQYLRHAHNHITPAVAAMDSCFALTGAHQHGLAVGSMGGGEKPAYQRLLSTRVNFLILPPYACRGRTVLRFSTNRYHLFIVEQALNEVLCTRLGSEGSKVWHDSYTMLMSPNDGEIAVRGCHCLGDMVVHMHAVLVRVLQWLVMRG